MPPLIKALPVIAAAGLASLAGARAQTIEDLGKLSIEDLGNVEVSSVMKAPERLSDAPAAIYVISHEEIMRSGRTTLPEILRLAPNLEVAQLTPTTYAITARGFNVANNAAMSNKLLILIDGRTVYTPLFAGVYWDMQSVLPENIERIEIISGPGATLWGSNAVNGVINVITRNSASTQGGFLELDAGNIQRGAALQYGGAIGKNLSYRVYGMGFNFDSYNTPSGGKANDGWTKPQGGFRVDWHPGGDSVMLQGDVFQAPETTRIAGGRDIVASWVHPLDNGSSLQLLTYYDRAYQQSAPPSVGGFSVDTYDVELQHTFHLGDSHEIVWGAGDRIIDYGIQDTATLLFVPSGRTMNLADVFAQDTISLTDSLKLTIGLKLENEPFAGLEPMPQGRLAWKVTDTALLWAAVSRAVRAPTPVDTDIVELIGSSPGIVGNPKFLPEALTAYEVGTRMQLSPRASLSLSAFYNVYDDLRTIEITPVTFFPLSWGNRLGAQLYGVEGWANIRPFDWWQLTPGFTLQHEHFRFDPTSSKIGGTGFVADDPHYQASLRSTVFFGHGVNWDTQFRYVGMLANPAVPAYGELDTRIAWQVTDRVELALAGYNLLHPQHLEFIEPGQSDAIPRSFLLQTRWRF